VGGPVKTKKGEESVVWGITPLLLTREVENQLGQLRLPQMDHSAQCKDNLLGGGGGGGGGFKC